MNYTAPKQPKQHHSYGKNHHHGQGQALSSASAVGAQNADLPQPNRVGVNGQPVPAGTLDYSRQNKLLKSDIMQITRQVQFQNIQTLLLDGCFLGNDRLQMLADSFHQIDLPSLQVLGLRSNYLIGIPAARALVQILKAKHTPLHTIRLSRNKLGDAGTAFLMNSLQDSQTKTKLQEVSLGHNELGGQCLRSIATTLALKPQLVSISLDQTSQLNMANICSKISERTIPMGTLSLRQVNLTDEGAKLIAKSLLFKNEPLLHTLCIHENHDLTDVGATALLDAQQLHIPAKCRIEGLRTCRGVTDEELLQQVDEMNRTCPAYVPPSKQQLANAEAKVKAAAPASEASASAAPDSPGGSLYSNFAPASPSLISPLVSPTLASPRSVLQQQPRLSRRQLQIQMPLYEEDSIPANSNPEQDINEAKTSPTRPTTYRSTSFDTKGSSSSSSAGGGDPQPVSNVAAMPTTSLQRPHMSLAERRARRRDRERRKHDERHELVDTAGRALSGQQYQPQRSESDERSLGARSQSSDTSSLSRDELLLMLQGKGVAKPDHHHSMSAMEDRIAAETKKPAAAPSDQDLHQQHNRSLSSSWNFSNYQRENSSRRGLTTGGTSSNCNTEFDHDRSLAFEYIHGDPPVPADPGLRHFAATAEGEHQSTAELLETLPAGVELDDETKMDLAYVFENDPDGLRTFLGGTNQNHNASMPATLNYVGHESISAIPGDFQRERSRPLRHAQPARQSWRNPDLHTSVPSNLDFWEHEKEQPFQQTGNNGGSSSSLRSSVATMLESLPWVQELDADARADLELALQGKGTHEVMDLLQPAAAGSSSNHCSLNSLNYQGSNHSANSNISDANLHASLNNLDIGSNDELQELRKLFNDSKEFEEFLKAQ